MPASQLCTRGITLLETWGQLPFQCEMYTTGYFWSLCRITSYSKTVWPPGNDQISLPKHYQEVVIHTQKKGLAMMITSKDWRA